MGCCASKSNFGEVREKMCHALQLQESKAFSATPSRQSVVQRDAWFARIQQLCANGKTPADVHSVTVAALTQFARDTWQLPSISPLNEVFAPRLAFVHARSGDDTTCASCEEVLMRWHFRPWLISMCETYHVLLLMDQHKLLAKQDLAWFRRACSACKSNMLSLQNAVAPSAKARAFLAQGAAIVVTRKSLTAAFLRDLQREMPGALDKTTKVADESGDTVSETWASICVGVNDYVRQRQTLQTASGANPLNDVYEGKTIQDAVPALAFVEWLAMRYGRALCGTEDTKATYLCISQCSDDVTKDPVTATQSTASEQSSGERPPDHVDGDAEEVDIELVLHCDALRVLLERLHALDRQIGELDGETELRARLRDERRRIEQILLRLFRHLSRDKMRLTEEETCVATYCELDAHLLYPERTAHDAIVKNAFSRAVTDDAATKEPHTREDDQAARQIADLSKFTAYLDAYLNPQSTHSDTKPSTPTPIAATPPHEAIPPSTHSPPLPTPSVSSPTDSSTVLRAGDSEPPLATRPQEFDAAWWLSIVDSIPYTSSTPHRQARRNITSAVNDTRQRDSKVTESADGYLPTRELAAVLRAEYQLDRVALYFYKLTSSEKDDWHGLSTGTTPVGHDEVWEAWFRFCVCETNRAVARADLAGEEVHPKDLRFLLQYIHHYMTIFSALHTSIVATQDNAQCQPTGQEQAYSPFLTQANDAFHAAFTRVVASLSSEAVSQIVVAKATAAATRQPASAERSDGDTREDFEGRTVNTLVAARLAAAALVKINYSLYDRTQRKYREMVEFDNLKTGAAQENGAEGDDEDDFACTITSMRQADCGTYWELLRLFLPYGTSSEHRSRRRQLFQLMDVKHKGYLTLSDLNRGISTVLPLRRFRADLTPVLFRAFTAVKEMTLAEDKIIFLTREEESFITQREFAAFLYYFYRYMELYYMFDVLTCSNHIQLDTLHVGEAEVRPDDTAADPLTGVEAPSPRSDQYVASSSTRLQGEMDATQRSTRGGHTPASALCAVAATPYQLTVEAAPMRKQVTLEQFRVAHSLLRRWGVHVKDFESVFRHINERCKKGGEMYFTWFAVWASEHNLRPEGYGHGFDEQERSDLFASLEVQLASLHMQNV